jgi:hypothetical protein
VNKQSVENTASRDASPAVVIRVVLEDGCPRVRVECSGPAEAIRLADWINSQEDLQDLVAFALSLDPLEVTA